LQGYVYFKLSRDGDVESLEKFSFAFGAVIWTHVRYKADSLKTRGSITPAVANSVKQTNKNFIPSTSF